MKKTVFLVSICMFLCTFSVKTYAQLDFGLRAGVSSSTIKMDDVKDKTGDELLMEAGDAKIGFHFGLVARAALLGFYVQPELLLTSNNAEVKVKDIQNGDYEIKKQKFTKIDIPIMAGKKIGPLRLQVGPIASIILKSDSKVEDLEGAKEEFKKATWGYQAGVGLDVWKFIFDVKYEGNFSKIGKKEFNFLGESYSTDARNPQWVFSLGYFF